MPSIVGGEVAWNAEIDGEIIARNVLCEGQNGWWPVGGLEVGEVDGEDLSVGVDG